MLTIQRVGQLTGATVRALRHYEVLGLLKPLRTGHGVRRYSRGDCRRALAITRLRKLDIPLALIGQILDAPDPEVRNSTLVSALSERLERLEALIPTVQAALKSPSNWLEDSSAE